MTTDDLGARDATTSGWSASLWRWGTIAVALAIAVVVVERIRTAEAPPPTRSRPARTPVTVITAAARDVPVYLNGLGAVTPLNTVTVKSRVDGQLDRVTFHEGDIVSKDSLLAEIDPRPFQVQLEQAEGQLARDQAQLDNAKVTLARYQLLWSQDSVAKQDLDAQAATVGQLEGALKSDQGAIASAKLNLTYSEIERQSPAAPASARSTRATSSMPPTERHRHPDPDRADCRGLHAAGGQPGIRPAEAAWQRDACRRRLRPARTHALGDRTRTDHRQRDRSHDRHIQVKALFDNRDDALFPQQFVNARLLSDTLRHQVVVPAAAVQRGTQGAFVYTVGSDRIAQLRHGSDRRQRRR